VKILVLRGGALGDMILTLPTLRELRKNYPDAYIELLGILPHAGLAAPQFVNAVARLDGPDLMPMFAQDPLPARLCQWLGQFDIAIDLFGDADSLTGRNLRQGGVKSVIARPRNDNLEDHAVYQLAAALKPLELTLSDPVPRLEIGWSPPASRRLAFHVGSGSLRKNWPIRHWVDLIGRIKPLFHEFLLVGGEADEADVRAFLAKSSFRNLKPLLSPNLDDLARNLKTCALYIGHDTGVTHLAAAVGVPTMALFGPTNSRVWAPLGEQVILLTSFDGKMESISVEEVLACLTAFALD